MTRSAADVRNDFLEFFRARRHAIVPGSPVVPYDDPTLLFTNAGMNQFKDVFLGTGTRAYKRAADSQPCIRAGGKHNDLDDVGQDTYHHTFFEMLGNWSFGDYFKKEAIEWAWELLTAVWGLEKDRLHVTYFQGDEQEGLEADLEAKELWAEVTDIDPTHIHPGSKKDNFWEMGDVGPCGPCSEIHIDLTPDKSGISLVNLGDPRVIEIWNLVFIQFNRDATGKLTPLPARHVDTGMGFERVCALLQGKSSNYDTDVFTPIFQAIRDVIGAPPYQGTLPEEPRTSVRAEPGALDAPRGLKPAAPHGAARDQRQVMIDVSYRVIADHIRCLTFALNDGCVPDREGRGYVLRRILRRAVRYGWQYMNMHEPFMYKLVPVVVDTLGDAFPQLKGSGRRLAGREELARSPAVGPERVAEIIREEEESFDRTLDRGLQLFQDAFDRALSRAKCRPRVPGKTTQCAITSGPWGFRHVWVLTIAEIDDDSQPAERFPTDQVTPSFIKQRFLTMPAVSGEDAFKLHDTYGFPIDLTQIMAEEKGLRVDIGEYERLMEQARERARPDSGSEDAEFAEQRNRGVQKARREGAPDDSAKYSDALECETLIMSLARHTGLFDTDSAKQGERIVFSLRETPFCAEQGGQVSDVGRVTTAHGVIEVQRVERHGDYVIHIGYVKEGEIRPGSMGHAVVSRKKRVPTMQNHTATHVMNWALREVLGEHVQQKGSLVDPDKTRFDFAHPKPLTPEEIERVEQFVNERIAQDLPVHWDDKVPLDAALSINGVRAVFGEKYPDPVRVVCCGVAIEELRKKPANAEWRKFPIELCGGTHCESTGQIERFAIVSEEAVAKGIRRVVAITGEKAQSAIDRGTELLRKAEELRRVGTAHGVAARASSAGEADVAPDVAAGLRAGREHRPDAGATNVAAGASRGRGTTAETAVPPGETGAPSLAQRGVGDGSGTREIDLASQVAELQQAVTESTIRVVDRIKLREALGELQQVLKQQQKQQAAGAKEVVADTVAELLKDAPKVGETTIVISELPDSPLDQLKTAADMIKQKCKSAAVLFGVRVGATGQGKALLLAAMSNDLVKKGLKAGDLIRHVAPIVEGRGGGPPTMAQAGGKNPARLAEALEAGRKWIGEKLG